MAVTPIHSPLKRETARSLKSGDPVSLSGTVVTARDQVHKYLASGGTPPMDLTGIVIYHCGPVVIKDGDTWRITAAGPTTSIREEPYEAEVISRFGPGAIMGKGGMGPVTQAALEANGCVYLHAPGGAAQYLAKCITRVEAVHLLEFGQPEAMWVLTVRNLPALVTMDAHGASFHEALAKKSLQRLNQLLGRETP
ncbi:MAG: FumA C-terminus/TtdB family hydratase beta subunit [Desulfomonilia bacterium]|nr:FumA C-terminus/TtdB family hydratase beta subunit [Desulfomonilia bacterium]